jgi:7,8-dihydroneopterin aldolase/epimerase/oxygenase
MDIVFIEQLRVDAIIGIHDWERRVRQTLLVDLEMATDAGRAAASESIDDALDYQRVAERVTVFIQAGEFQLLETLAHELAADLQAQFELPWLKLRVAKPGAIPAAQAVGVVVERGIERGQFPS